MTAATCAAAVLVAAAAARAAGAQAPAADTLPPAAVVDSLTAAYNAHDADRFARWLSDTVAAGDLAAPATAATRGRAAMRAQARRAFAAAPGLRVTRLARVVRGEVVIDRERLDGLPGGPIEDVVVLHVRGGRVVRIWTTPVGAPHPAPADG